MVERLVQSLAAHARAISNSTLYSIEVIDEGEFVVNQC